MKKELRQQLFFGSKLFGFILMKILPINNIYNGAVPPSIFNDWIDKSPNNGQIGQSEIISLF